MTQLRLVPKQPRVVAVWTKTWRPITQEEWNALPWWQRGLGWLAVFFLASRYR